jgi:hypothetical protein
LPKGPE